MYLGEEVWTKTPKRPRHRLMTGPTDVLRALTRLSLVGLLLSRARLRQHRVQYSIEMKLSME